MKIVMFARKNLNTRKNENSTEEIRKKLEAGKLIILWLVGYYKNLLLRGERRESWKYVNCL